MTVRKKSPAKFRSFSVAAMVVALGFVAPRLASAHCDTMNGPVVQAAQNALAKGDVTPVLKWVKKEHEGETRKAFQETLSVRAQSAEARGLADRYFFETVVRIHRLGEGAPYTGLKPEGSEAGPAIEGADQALRNGSVEALTRLVSAEIGEGIRTRFARAMEKKQHAEASVEAGREFVAAYVEFIHYAERIHQAAGATAGHLETAAEEEHAHER